MWGMGTFWKCVLVKFVLNEFVLTKDLVYTNIDIIAYFIINLDFKSKWDFVGLLTNYLVLYL